MTVYDEARQVLEHDLADQPERLAAALARLDAVRMARAARPATCTSCGKGLTPGQVMHCSPKCANDEWKADKATKAAANARWKAEHMAAEASR